MLPSAATVFDVINVTWPAAQLVECGPLTLRDGQGGGGRVAAATLCGDAADLDLTVAEEMMQAMGQPALFSVKAGEDAYDAALAAAGYLIRDPSVLYAGLAADIAKAPEPVTRFTCWPPLAAQVEIWREGGIGPARIAVMERADCMKVSMLARAEDRPAGTVYAGIAEDCAMIHALEVAPAMRRKGLARMLTQAVAQWAVDQGVTYLTLVTTEANVAANALYSSLGMRIVGRYHYRIRPEENVR